MNKAEWDKRDLLSRTPTCKKAACETPDECIRHDMCYWNAFQLPTPRTDAVSLPKQFIDHSRLLDVNEYRKMRWHAKELEMELAAQLVEDSPTPNILEQARAMSMRADFILHHLQADGSLDRGELAKFFRDQQKIVELLTVDVEALLSDAR